MLDLFEVTIFGVPVRCLYRQSFRRVLKVGCEFFLNGYERSHLYENVVTFHIRRPSQVVS